MTAPTTSTTRAEPATRTLLNKVPEVVIWFWIIKVLCTTVGESFADWINETLGVGLLKTSLLFTVVLAVVLVVQLRLPRYVPIAYWLTVVVLSVTGTLYTDILTDQLNVPLVLSTTVFAVALAVVFGIWYSRERTLSIHSIVTRPREAFYWLAVLVTFALGTAAGDWILELTGWPPGRSVLLPAALIVAVVIGWRLGANPVLSFWLAYILTRPLGANLGDFLALPKSEGGLGLGTAATSIIFLAAIVATVLYLTVTRSDVIEDEQPRVAAPRNPQRERMMVGYFAVVAIAAGGILAFAHSQPHAAAAAAEEGPAATGTTLTPQQATQSFPAAEIAKLRTVTQGTLTIVQAGDQAAAKTSIKQLETAWDDDQATLQPLDKTAWTFLDGQIDVALQAVRAGRPDRAAETAALGALLQSFG
jgi:uncharacterized membrane-anchored protein